MCSRQLTEIFLQDVSNDAAGGSEILKAHDNNLARLPSAEEIHELVRELNVLKQNFSNKAINNKRNVRSSYFSFVCLCL